MNGPETSHEVAPAEKPKPGTIALFESSAIKARKILDAKDEERSHRMLPLRKDNLVVAVNEAPDGRITSVRYDKIHRKPNDMGVHQAEGFLLTRDEQDNVKVVRTKDSYYYLGRGAYGETQNGFHVEENQPVTDADVKIAATELAAFAKKQQQKMKHRYGRRVAAGVTIAAVALGGTVYQLVSPETKPPVEQIAYPPGSLEARVQMLAQDPRVNRAEQITDLTAIGKSIALDEYNDREDLPAAYPAPLSVPIFEIGYNPTTSPKTLALTNSRLETFGADRDYHLFAPFVKDPIVKAAFDSGMVKNVVVRMTQSDNIDDLSGMSDEGTVYLFIPQNVDYVNYRVLIRHEFLHKFADKSGLSEFNTGRPTPEEEQKWQKICGDIRDIALNQANQHMGELLSIMEEGRKVFLDSKQYTPEYAEAFNELYLAMQNGDFDKYQPTSSDSLPGKIKNCQTIGPADAFYALLQKNNLGNGKAYVQPLTDAETKLVSDMGSAWYKTLPKQTIYDVLNEGNYVKEAGGAGNRGGHTQKGLDELEVSTWNLVLSLPDQYADTIKDLPAEEKTAALELIDESIEMLKTLTPADQSEVHTMIKTNYGMFKKALAK